MQKIKKAGIVAGAVVGGVIGGAVSLAGKITKVDFVDGLGENIMDSTIHTGSIVGDLASGTGEIIKGKVKKDEDLVKVGADELKAGGGKIVNNFVDNVKLVGGSTGEVAKGVVKLDGKRVKKGLKKLAKVAVVGITTVGAIKIDDCEEKKEN